MSRPEIRELITMEFMLVQKAKSKGGDKYACISDPSFTIYVPQTISRDGDQPYVKLRVDISPIVSTVPPITLKNRTQIDDEEV